MISLTCTNCQTVLTIDDAFAGGVCRCQHCGTIQTVPSHLKRKRSTAPGTADASGNAATATPASGRTLYQKRARPAATSGTGLEQLADVVAGSGLSRGGGASAGGGRGEAKAQATAAPPRRGVPIAGGAGLAVIAAIVLVAWWFMSNPAAPAPAVQSPSPAPGTAE